MVNLGKLTHTHSDKLERWLGKEQVAAFSDMMKDWHGPPIPVAGVPGNVHAVRGGDFIGRIDGGGFASFIEHVAERQKSALRRWHRNQTRTLNAGFSGFADLVSEAVGNGKGQVFQYSKSLGNPSGAGSAISSWRVSGGWPAQGGLGGTSGTGRVLTKDIVGALGPMTNAISGDTLHFCSWNGYGTVNMALMLVDRLWDMAYNLAAATSTPVDAANRPTRYQTAALAPGSFISGEITTTLGATVPNITITYVDDAGNTAEAAAAFTPIASDQANRVCLPSTRWFVPLNAGDSGARYITDISQSTIASVTGVACWWVAHPLALLPALANVPCALDGIRSGFNLARVYDDACLNIYCPVYGTTSGSAISGTVTLISG